MTRRALVTGASRGIGAAIAHLLARSGHHVVGVGRDKQALLEMRRAAAASAGQIDVAVCDVRGEQPVADLFARVGPIDILVNNAGVSSSAPVARTSLDDWRSQLDTSATAVFLCTRAALPSMVSAGWGRVVTVASTAGVRGERYTAAYAASKHAAVGLMRVVAAETAGSGVTANAVCPAFVDTAMTGRTLERISAATGRDDSGATAALVGSTELRRLLHFDYATPWTTLSK